MHNQYDQDEDDIQNKLKAIEDKINANHYQVPNEVEEEENTEDQKEVVGNDMFFPTEIETNYERKPTADTKTAETKSTR